jgi:hypothetical protein
VKEDWLNDLSSTTSVDLSKTEALGTSGERWISLALRRRLGLWIKNDSSFIRHIRQ